MESKPVTVGMARIVNDPKDPLSRVPRRFVVVLWRDPSQQDGTIRGSITPASPDRSVEGAAPRRTVGFEGLESIAPVLRQLLGTDD